MFKDLAQRGKNGKASKHSDGEAAQGMPDEEPRPPLISFCKVLAGFEPAEYPSSSPEEALDDYLEGAFSLQGVDSREQGFHIGRLPQIAARQNCAFCRLAYSTVVEAWKARGRELEAENRELFVIMRNDCQFDICTQDRRGKVNGSILPLGERITPCVRGRSSSARSGRPVNSETIDITRVRQWLTICEQNHSGVCPGTPSTTPLQSQASVTIRLINVHDENIVQLPRSTRYIALSYVWGRGLIPILVKNTELLLGKPGSLNKYSHLVPRTVKDAMKFVKNLGEDFLWVDFLCLVQDDQDDLHRGIGMMNLIYEGAYATIIAASGSTADDGLPRTCPGEEQAVQNIEEMIPGLELMNVRSLDCHLRNSIWATRGWTQVFTDPTPDNVLIFLRFQEQFLSRRTIIFMNCQVYFRCRLRIWSEETCADEHPQTQFSDEWAANWIAIAQEDYDTNEGDLHPIIFMLELLVHYQRRNLTMDTDAINAVSGILLPIAFRSKTTLLAGLPVVALDLILLILIFSTDNDRAHIRRKVRRRLEFPSWSWAGWVGEVSWGSFNELYKDDDHLEKINAWLDEHTWIVWYKYQHGNLTEAVWEPELKNTFRRTDEDIFYHRREQPDLSSRFPIIDTKRTKPSNCYLIKSYPLLTFYTVAVNYRASISKHQSQVSQSTPNLSRVLRGIGESVCGFLTLDLELTISNGEMVELILLSETRNNFCVQSPGDNGEQEFPSIWYGEDTGSEYELYWAMLIVWTGEVYERRGLGQIHRSALEHSYAPGPEWKEVVLG